MSRATTARRIASLAVFGVSTQLAGCYTWEPTTISPAQWAVEARPATTVSAASPDSLPFASGAPNAAGAAGAAADTTTGVDLFTPERYRTPDNVRVTDFGTVEVRRIDGGRTAALVMGSIFASLWLADALMPAPSSGGSSSSGSPSRPGGGTGGPFGCWFSCGSY